MDVVNRQMVLKERPTGAVGPEHFELVEAELPALSAGEVRVRNRWLSFDPAQRGWINDVKSYVPPVAIGEPMRAFGVGEVVASEDPAFEPGTLVEGTLGWQEHWQGPGRGNLEPLPDDLPRPEMALGVMGVTGLTAYFGMTDVGRPGPGDAVLVTSAAGATGSIAGQIARIRGADLVVGTAGSPEKRAWVVDVAGYDDCLDHYDEKVGRAMRAAAPDGYDVIFDNVGGRLLDQAIFNVALHGRIALCGSISTGYRPERPAEGLHNYQLLTTKRARMEGFLLFDFHDRFAEARAELAAWIADGRLHFEEDVLVGLEAAPAGLQRLFEGGNLGKQILRLDPEAG